MEITATYVKPGNDTITALQAAIVKVCRNPQIFKKLNKIPDKGLPIY
jgi:hypothetical protein